MGSFARAALERLSNTGLGKLGIRAPFTIPSGIVTTIPSVIARVARDISEIGFLTTKTISVEPREGYREPILYEYEPRCFVNAVGLANPGAATFRDAMMPLLPLHDAKPLVVSIMGGKPDEFLTCALILDPIADAFELNLSCPHVKGAGQSVGSDPDTVREIIRTVKGRIGKPIIPKLSPNLGDVGSMAALCEEEGADALTLINTVGPGTACDADGNPVLSNVNGGLSGAGIVPIGLKAIREAAARVNIPIIACGGIGSPEDLIAYFRAGACLFGVGSALAGMTTTGMARFFKALDISLEGWSETDSLANKERTRPPSPRLLPLRQDDELLASQERGSSVTPFSGRLNEAWGRQGCLSHPTRTAYAKAQVAENIPIGPDLFKLVLDTGVPCEPGQFFFLRLPGVGEKPFSPAAAIPPVYLVRKVGPFTKALENLKTGDNLYMRGPYGRGFPQPEPETRLVLVAGGTGAAPVLMAASKWKENVVMGFFGFSAEIATGLKDGIVQSVPGCHLVIDPPGRTGEVVRALLEQAEKEPAGYRRCTAFLCGPNPMMRAAVEVLQDPAAGGIQRDRIFTAREDIIRCGIGICGSCGTSSGLRSCVDGPVMPPES